MMMNPNNQESEKSTTSESAKARKKAVPGQPKAKGISMRDFDKKMDEIAKSLSVPFKLDKRFKKAVKEKIFREALENMDSNFVRAELKATLGSL